MAVGAPSFPASSRRRSGPPQRWTKGGEAVPFRSRRPPLPTTGCRTKKSSAYRTVWVHENEHRGIAHEGARPLPVLQPQTPRLRPGKGWGTQSLPPPARPWATRPALHDRPQRRRLQALVIRRRRALPRSALAGRPRPKHIERTSPRACRRGAVWSRTEARSPQQVPRR